MIKGIRWFSLIPFLLISCEEREAPSTPQFKVNSVIASKEHSQVERITEEITPFSFLFYNLKNYLSISTYSKGKFQQERFKPAEECNALYEVITSANPDILGVCEVGSEDDLKKLQTELKLCGATYEHTTYCLAPDGERHLALLSKYPISVENHSTDQCYWIGKHQFPIQRGILDCSIKIEQQTVRFVGIHLKSKRVIDEASETEMRAQEAILVKAYLDEIMEATPRTPLLFFGDLNDTVQSRTLKILKGKHGINTHLKLLSLEDSEGNSWTHEWGYQDVYSRIDYVFCSRALKPFFDKKASRILDSPEVDAASDHRPLFVQFE